MPIIKVKNLVKQYKIIEKQEGILGYFKNLIRLQYKKNYGCKPSVCHFR